ncbi:MAG TPA: 4-hydroxy-tetrahydrodipicolinate reductase [bacterium]|nr:4-hydroxy-tetrahydrodipicolinate reductase [Chlamydiota bacterium]HOE26223.1 4-hydroxy-tetrahydrodipicolinate reductase [bacterium]
MQRIVVCGACGRMGKRIIACAAEDPGIAVAGAVERAGHPCLGADAGACAGVGEIGVAVSADLEAAARGADVIVDFSGRETAVRNAAAAASLGMPIVIGTTGLGEEQLHPIRAAAEKVACVVAPNMSVGANLLIEIAAETARLLGDDYDVEIVETHHRMKKDAPSGTALALARAVAGARGIDLPGAVVYGRSGHPGARPKGQIGIHAVRQGDVVGDHVVGFAAPGERIELVHRATSRDTFARGALRAAKWVAKKAPGIYGMADVLREG